MIRKVASGDTSNQIASIYKKFDLSSFRDIMSEMRNECEKYFDSQDLEQVMNGKKDVTVLANQMRQNYSQVYAHLAML